MNVDELLKLTPDAFEDVVDKEVRGQVDGETARSIRDPRLSERSYYVLTTMKKNVESQLAARRLDVARINGQPGYNEALTDFHRWKAGAVRFKNGVENRLMQIRAMRGTVFPDGDIIKWERNVALGANQRMIEAILKHRDTVLKEFDADDVDDTDRELWKVIEY